MIRFEILRISSSCSRLAAPLQKASSSDDDVEVVLDRVLAAAGDEDDVGDTGRDRLLDAVWMSACPPAAAFPWAAPWSRAGTGCRVRRRGRRPCGSERAFGYRYCSVGLAIADSPMLDPAFVRDHIDAVQRTPAASARRRLLEPSSNGSPRSKRSAAGVIPQLEGLKREQNTPATKWRARSGGPGRDPDLRGQQARGAADQAARESSSMPSSSSAAAAAGDDSRTCPTRACRRARAPPTTSSCGRGASRRRSTSAQGALGPRAGARHLDFERAHEDLRRRASPS